MTLEQLFIVISTKFKRQNNVKHDTSGPLPDVDITLCVCLEVKRGKLLKWLNMKLYEICVEQVDVSIG